MEEAYPVPFFMKKRLWYFDSKTAAVRGQKGKYKR
jgi:hypothetical protein